MCGRIGRTGLRRVSSLNPTEHVLDTIVWSIEVLVALGRVLSFGAGWDAGGDSLVFQSVATPIGTLSALREQFLCAWQSLEQMARQAKCALHFAERAGTAWQETTKAVEVAIMLRRRLWQRHSAFLLGQNPAIPPSIESG